MSPLLSFPSGPPLSSRCPRRSRNCAVPFIPVGPFLASWLREPSGHSVPVFRASTDLLRSLVHTRFLVLADVVHLGNLGEPERR